MARAPRKKAEDNPLLSAMRFVQIAQQEQGAPYQTHSRFLQNRVLAYDGILAAGIPVAMELPEGICPNTYQLIHAMERAKDTSAVTFENSSVIVKTNKYRAIVPCIPPDVLNIVGPDDWVYPLTDDFRVACQRASVLTREGAQRVVEASIMTRNGSIVGTNGNVLIEAWHGTPTPPGLIIPKSFVDALVKVKKKIVGFGFSDLSFTVGFDDGSFIKTQLYKEEWPSIDLILSYTETANPVDLPKDFFEGVKSVSPFSEDNRVYFGENNIRSHAHNGKGADYTVKGIPDGEAFNIKHLLALEGQIQKIDFTGNERVAVFFGENVRGAISRSNGNG